MIFRKKAELEGVTEYDEGYPVTLQEMGTGEETKEVIMAKTGHGDYATIDAKQLMNWMRKNRPDLLVGE